MFFSTKDLKKRINFARDVVRQKSAMEILKNFKVKISDKGLFLKASNLFTEINIKVDKAVGDSGDSFEKEFLVDANFFSKIVSSAKSDQFDISEDGKSDSVVKLSEKSSQYIIPIINSDDFPGSLKAGKSYNSIKLDVIKRISPLSITTVDRKTKIADYKGIFFGEDKIISSDRSEISFTENTSGISNVMLSPDDVLMITKIFKDPQVSINEDVVSFKEDKIQYKCRSLASKYPVNYNQLTDCEIQKKYEIDKKLFIESVEKAVMLDSSEIKRVDIKAENNIIKFAGFGVGKSNHEMLTDSQVEFEFHINGVSLMQALSNLAGEKLYIASKEMGVSGNYFIIAINELDDYYMLGALSI